VPHIASGGKQKEETTQMNVRRTSASLFMIVMALFVLSGCGTTGRDWKQAKDANTITAYTRFLAEHPSGAHVDEAKAAIDDLDWLSAKAKDTYADYDKYLTTYPAGRHAGEAKAALQAIEDATYTPLEASCGARVAEMESTFFGKPSGELVSFECETKQGKTVKLGLKSKKFQDGKIETQDFGIIIMNGEGEGYEIQAGQMRKLQSFLGLDANGAQSTAKPN
jgi:hypothetical protein